MRVLPMKKISTLFYNLDNVNGSHLGFDIQELKPELKKENKQVFNLLGKVNIKVRPELVDLILENMK